MSPSEHPTGSQFGRRFRAILVPLLIACFIAVLVFSGCAALDEASVARTDRLKPEQFYKSYRKSAGTEEPALLLSVMTDDGMADRLEHLRTAIETYLPKADDGSLQPGMSRPARKA